MRAGVLDQRVRIQKPSLLTDQIGQPIDAWVTLGECWAQVSPLQGREFIAAASFQSEVSAKIRMRYRPGITSAMRVIHGQDVYQINAVIHIKSGRDVLELMVKSIT